MESGPFLIGELARLTSISPKTIRYYEDVDLLPRSKRGANNYRVYSEDTVQRINFIKTAQNLGLTLRKIKEILGISDRGYDPCERSTYEQRKVEPFSKIETGRPNIYLFRKN